MQEVDKIALIHLRDEKILSTRSKGKKVFYIPGGKREAGESDKDTLIREVKEELQVSVLEETIEFLGVFTAQSDGAPTGVNVKMTCYRAEFMGQLYPDNEIEEIVWLSYSDFDKVSEVDKKIFDYLKHKGWLQ
jgi:8-oxo-dGTP pyrophosphatase MutT (NUDIX family)